jgi:ATP-dependent DNA ligase
MNLPFDPPIAPMEARHVDGLPLGEGWQYEPKWDGFRAIAFRDGSDVYISSRGELPFARYYPELVEGVLALAEPRVVVDGEIVVFTPDGLGLDFDALQQRIHPAASRIVRLSKETPASFIAFDLLALGDRDLRQEPFATRRRALEDVMAAATAPLYVSPRTGDPEVAGNWLESFTVRGLDGVVAKRLDAPYRSGEREMRKVKRQRTADTVLVGWRWAKDQRGVAVGSLLLGLYDHGGELRQVGFTSGFTQPVRREMVPLLESHRSGPTVEMPPGPEGRSRWARDRDLSFEPLKPELVCEVAFDQLMGDRIRHGAKFVRWRQDKPASQCTFDQLEQYATVDVRQLLG